MTKPISVRLDEAVIQTLKERAAEAGVSQAEYLTGLIVVGPVIERVVDEESERVQALLAAAVVAQGVEAELREEIRDLKRKLRESREPDAPKKKESLCDTPTRDVPKSDVRCPHNQVWRFCKWIACREADPRAALISRAAIME